MARAATFGAVDTIFVDIDEVVPGSVDETSGAVTFSAADDAVNYGVVDEIARRVWLNGGRVLAVRRDDIPGNGSASRSSALRALTVERGRGPAGVRRLGA